MIIHFAQQSVKMERALVNEGGFVVDCDDGQGHVNFDRLGLGGNATEFFKSHGYNQRPYGDTLPSDWPDVCQIVK